MKKEVNAHSTLLGLPFKKSNNVVGVETTNIKEE